METFRWIFNIISRIFVSVGENVHKEKIKE
jgi:hypothetical protein